MAMAEHYRDHVKDVTLRRYGHAPATETDSPPGQPPAWVSGELARSITAVQGPSSGTYATATVGPHVIYARIQELGGHIRPVRARYLRWTEDGITHYSKHVYLPPRPYMAPALADCIADGSLTAGAAAAFMAEVWG
jgi:phage gpG-like protein